MEAALTNSFKANDKQVLRDKLIPREREIEVEDYKILNLD